MEIKDRLILRLYIITALVLRPLKPYYARFKEQYKLLKDKDLEFKIQ